MRFGRWLCCFFPYKQRKSMGLFKLGYPVPRIWWLHGLRQSQTEESNHQHVRIMGPGSVLCWFRLHHSHHNLAKGEIEYVWLVASGCRHLLIPCLRWLRQVDHMFFVCWNGQREDQPCTSECRECWLAKWRFPNMGVPPNHSKLDNFSTETYGFGDLPF